MELSAEKVRQHKIYRITLWGSLVNFLLLVFKFIAGIAGNSAAMLADAIHSLSDFITDFVVILFVRIAGKPVDKDHGYGHGKYETLATAIIALFLLGVGVMICWQGTAKIIGYLQGEALEAPGMIALWAALISIVLKELLYRWTAHVGKKVCSDTVVANAWHHRSDALSSIGTAIGIGGAILLGEEWRVLDPIAAVVVSAFIIRMALKLLLNCTGELLEEALPEEDEAFIMRTVLDHEGVSDPHNLRTRKIGNYCSIELHLRMDGNTSLSDAHAVTRSIEDRLRDKFGKHTIINTHVEPVK